MGLRPTRETMKMGYAGAAAFRSTSGIWTVPSTSPR